VKKALSASLKRIESDQMVREILTEDLLWQLII